MTYSLDFRLKVLEVIQAEGLTLDEAAERFKVGRASIARWKQRVEPKRTRYKPAITVDRIALAADVRLYPDSYLFERAERLGVSKSGVDHAMKRMNISYKKNSETPKS